MMEINMNNIALTKAEFQKILVESFAQALELKKDLIQNSVNSAIEEIALAKAIETGKTGKYVSKRKVLELLRK
jgi:hypothetical protein